MRKNKPIELVICSGVQGPSVYLNDHRIAGNKPWGGGQITSRFKTTIKDLEDALNITIIKKSLKEPTCQPN